MEIQFEGPEKKVECIFPCAPPGLRSNTDGRWHRIVRASGADVISTVSTRDMDAYLLSESSLFVWTDRILIITCGETHPIQAIPEILKITAPQVPGMLIYERKNLMYPHKQQSNFETEVSRIKAFFPGKSYRLGPADHDHIHIFFSSHAKPLPRKDAFMEVLMHDLDPFAMDMFSPAGGRGKKAVLDLTGLDRLYPDMTIDSHLFTPHGFSLNGIRKDRFYAVHVTPQPAGSYASFETNMADTDYQETANRLLALFKPGRFSFVLTHLPGGKRQPLMTLLSDHFEGYKPAERSLYEFDCGYAVGFSNYIAEEGRADP